MSELLNADAPTGSPPASPPRGRPRLQLKKRDPAAAARLAQQAPRRGSNPFGDAKPREEVLTNKGIDVKAMDRKTELKAQAAHRLTRQQREEADAIAAEVKHAEEALREVRSRRPVVLWCFHFLRWTRVRLTMTWVVSFSSLRPILRAGALDPRVAPGGPSSATHARERAASRRIGSGEIGRDL